MVEFAIALGVFAFLVLGLVEFGLLFWEKNTVVAAAREGARYAMVRGSASGREATTDSVRLYVVSKTSLTPLSVTAAWPTTNDPGEIVNVNVRYTHKLVFPMLDIVIPDSVVLASTSRMVIAY